MPVRTDLVFQIADETALDRLKADVAKHGAILAPLGTSAPPPQFSDAEVTLKTAHAKTIGKVSGQVVQVTELGEVVVMLSAESKDAVSQYEFETSAAPSISPGGLDPSKPLWSQYEAMSRTEKMKLARQGNAEGRRMVLKDRDQILHKMVLNNPGLTVKELVSILRNNQASAVMIKSIMERSEWMTNLSLMEALVFNPLTPTDKAVKLVPKISMDAARRIVKTGKCKEAVKRAARLRVHPRDR